AVLEEILHRCGMGAEDRHRELLQHVARHRITHVADADETDTHRHWTLLLFIGAAPRPGGPSARTTACSRSCPTCRRTAAGTGARSSPRRPCGTRPRRPGSPSCTWSPRSPSPS